MKNLWLDLALRFVLGGGTIVICYILSVILPWKAFAGIFAAFPAVMIAAVSMAGIGDGSRSAGEVAGGAVVGMLGCATCVLTAIFCMAYFRSWQVGLSISLVVWFISSIFYFKVMGHIKNKKVVKG